MEKVLKKEFRLSAKSRMSMAAIIILLLLISGCVFGWLRENIRAVVRHEAEKNVTNISELNADAVYRELANRQILLESIANSLSDGTEYNTYKLLEKMRFYADNYNFYNMGVLTPEGILYTTTEKIVDVSKDTEYTKALDGTPIISKSFLAADGGNRMVNLLTEPVYDNNHKLRFILTGTYRSADLAKSLNISALDGRGYSFLVDSDGEAVIYPRIGEDEKYLGLLKHINNSTDILPSAEGKKDSFFWYGGEQYYAHFEKNRHK